MPEGTQVVLRYRDGRAERATLIETDAEREVFKVAHDGGASNDVLTWIGDRMGRAPHPPTAEPRSPRERLSVGVLTPGVASIPVLRELIYQSSQRLLAVASTPRPTTRQ